MTPWIVFLLYPSLLPLHRMADLCITEPKGDAAGSWWEQNFRPTAAEIHCPIVVSPLFPRKMLPQT